MRASRWVGEVVLDIAEADLFCPAARLDEDGFEVEVEVEAFLRSSSSRCSRIALAFVRFIS